MRICATLLLMACGTPLGPAKDASYGDIDGFVPISSSPPPVDSGSPPPMMDAGLSGAPPKYDDGGLYAMPPSPNRVFCGQYTCDSTQNVCCLDDAATCGPKGTACMGRVTFACDGPEDCPRGEHCCLEPTDADGGRPRIDTLCRSNCDFGPTYLCHSHLDCGADRPACCRGPDSFPLGHCLPPDSASPNDECDVP